MSTLEEKLAVLVGCGDGVTIKPGIAGSPPKWRFHVAIVGGGPTTPRASGFGSTLAEATDACLKYALENIEMLDDAIAEKKRAIEGAL